MATPLGPDRSGSAAPGPRRAREVPAEGRWKDTRFVVFPDDGHSRSHGNWRNAIPHYTEVEDVLARCLRGRRSP